MVQFRSYGPGIDMQYKRLVAGLIDLGVRPGGVLLVHSSLRSLGLLAGDYSRPEMVVSALLDVLGIAGTLLMPALSYESVSAQQPVFDTLHTPSCVGALTEFFRTRQGTIRSEHPTHSVCGVGNRVLDLLGTHYKDNTPCGPNSPFARLPLVGGQILFLGCGLRPNTSMHAIEEKIEPEYLYREMVDYTIVHQDGHRSIMSVRQHNFLGWEQRYDRLEIVMSDGLRKGYVLQAACYLIDSPKMWTTALKVLQKNPLYFVEQST